MKGNWVAPALIFRGLIALGMSWWNARRSPIILCKNAAIGRISI